MKTVKTDLVYWAFIDKHPDFTGIAIDHDGDKVWIRNGKPHREEGPAVEYVSGDKEWYLNGKYMSEEEHRGKVRIKKLESFLSQEGD